MVQVQVEESQTPAEGTKIDITSMLQPVAPPVVGRVAATVEVKDLSAYYGKFRAIKDVTISVAPNRVTAIIGPSGCGKSTLIRCLNRMHEVTPGARAQGKVELNGLDIYGANIDPVQVRRVVGMVFQKPNPFPMMTIHDNVVSGLLLQGGIRRAELEETAERALRQA